MGSGESFRSLMLAQAAQQRWPEARIGFLTAADHRDLGFDAFERHVVPGRVSRNDAAVLDVLQRTRPDVVIFDNRGSTTSIVNSARLGARTVYIAPAAQLLKRAFRLRRLRRLDQLWLVQRRFGPEPATLSGSERVRVALARGPEIHFFDSIFPEVEPARRARLLSELELDAGRYALFSAGGGGTAHEGRPVPEIFADAAGRVHRATGIPCVAVMGPLYSGHTPPQEGVTLVPSLAPPKMIDLLSAAEVVACGGGDVVAQALALERLCVVASTGGPDQPERIRACARAGLVQPAPIEAAAIAEGVITLLQETQRRERIRSALAASGLRNGLPRALDALGSLLVRAGETPRVGSAGPPL